MLGIAWKPAEILDTNKISDCSHVMGEIFLRISARRLFTLYHKIFSVFVLSGVT